MSFGNDVSKWGEDTKKRMLDIKREAAFDLFSSIIIMTPVDKGYLINNWFANNGETSKQTTESAGKTGQAAIKRVKLVLAGNGIGVPLFMSNNLPYARRIEYEGHSKKAINGMVRVNVARWDTIVNNVKRKYGV